MSLIILYVSKIANKKKKHGRRSESQFLSYHQQKRINKQTDSSKNLTETISFIYYNYYIWKKNRKWHKIIEIHNRKAKYENNVNSQIKTAVHD